MEGSSGADILRALRGSSLRPPGSESGERGRSIDCVMIPYLTTICLFDNYLTTYSTTYLTTDSIADSLFLLIKENQLFFSFKKTEAI